MRRSLTTIMTLTRFSIFSRRSPQASNNESIDLLPMRRSLTVAKFSSSNACRPMRRHSASSQSKSDRLDVGSDI